MQESERLRGHADFLSSPFLSIPYALMERYGGLGLAPDEFLVLLQILAAIQVGKRDFMSPAELSERCGLPPSRVSDIVARLVSESYLAIGERLEDDGTRRGYFDLKPLWIRLRGKDPNHSPVREWRKDPVTLFEEEFGRPLSGLELEQIGQWLETDRHPEWLIVEALREAVLANKLRFKYIDRILYEWQRHRIRTKQELEAYREGYRERIQAHEETAASRAPRDKGRSNGTRVRQDAKTSTPPSRDERYSAFYDLFPDA